MARVTGIGGVFLRAKDPKALAAWYAKHLNIVAAPWGIKFVWSDEVPKGTGSTAWSTFPADSKYFGPNLQQQVMINYRVDDLDALLAQLEKDGVTIDPKRDNGDFGKFAWITDPEGNRLELWQPVARKQGA